ncbi:MAG: hypothetical protein ACON5K_11615 [Bacteroidia bacterium]
MNLTEDQKFAIQVASPTAQNWLQNRYNKQAFQRSKDFYWEQWNANNEYNTPSAQRKRLEEAGFNPALMYNQSGGTGNATMTSGPEMSPTQVAPLPGGLEYSQLQLIKSQIDETDAKARLLVAERYTEEYEANLKKLQGKLTDEQRRELEIRNEKLAELLEMQLKKDQSLIDKQMSDIDVNTQNIKESGQKIKESEQRIAESKNRVNIELVNYALRKQLTEAQVNELAKKLEKIDAEIAKMGLEGKYLEKMSEYTSAKELSEYLSQDLMRLERDGFGRTSSAWDLVGNAQRFLKSLF